jgi:excisionase family DNA binding protein
MKPLMSVEEAAGLLGISPWTVRSYIHNGKLRPVRLGRRVLLEEAELERLITDCHGVPEEFPQKSRDGEPTKEVMR